jgi:hypothetical protein
MTLAFYAPLKSPDHPTPSGDRRMARALVDALGRTGRQVEIACRLRSYDLTGDARRLKDKPKLIKQFFHHEDVGFYN